MAHVNGVSFGIIIIIGMRVIIVANGLVLASFIQPQPGLLYWHLFRSNNGTPRITNHIGNNLRTIQDGWMDSRNDLGYSSLYQKQEKP
jgi:hypothetical protein